MERRTRKKEKQTKRLRDYLPDLDETNLTGIFVRFNMLIINIAQSTRNRVNMDNDTVEFVNAMEIKEVSALFGRAVFLFRLLNDN